jgi:hypothetical protein
MEIDSKEEDLSRSKFCVEFGKSRDLCKVHLRKCRIVPKCRIPNNSAPFRFRVVFENFEPFSCFPETNFSCKTPSENCISINKIIISEKCQNSRKKLHENFQS